MGRHGRLPWHIPEDLRFFHAKTAGKTCILGRICFQSWPRATQDDRQPIVVTRDRTLASDRVHVTGSFTEALALADALPNEIYVLGGERIYAETLALAGQRPLQLLLTLIHADVAGDTHFPEWRHLGWREVARRESADENFRYTFLTLEL